jgi:CHC2-type zinc finger protein/Toprim domain-containing protein
MSAPGLLAGTRQLKATTSIALVIGETLSLKRDGRFYVALCPFHGEKTPSFHVYPDHFHCFGCGAHGDVIDWLIRARRMTFAEAVLHLAGGTHRRHRAVSSLPLPMDAAENTGHVELARRIWCDAVDPRGTATETYLHRRGVRLPDAPVIRFHPRCPRKDGPLPAMVALMTDPVTGEPRGVHRTFLLSDGSGKARVAKPKMMLGRSGVVRLVDLDEISIGLGLTEGIETALTVMQRIGWGPVWAATSAGAIASFPALRVTTLNIFADHDPAGLTAARDCAARWNGAGAEVLIHTPPPGEDWADAARRLAA